MWKRYRFKSMLMFFELLAASGVIDAILNSLNCSGTVIFFVIATYFGWWCRRYFRHLNMNHPLAAAAAAEKKHNEWKETIKKAWRR